MTPASGGHASAIREVYDGLAPNSHDGVGLADLRMSLRAYGISNAELDATLKELSRQGKVDLFPVSARATLKQRDHDAALRIGGEDNHMVMFR